MYNNQSVLKIKVLNYRLFLKGDLTMTHDYIVRGLAYGGEIRAYAAITTESVQEAQTRHYTWPTACRYGKNYDSYCYDGCNVKRKSKVNSYC